jgi:VanZ family protein
MYADDFFRAHGAMLVTVTSGADGTAVYRDGELVRQDPGFRSPPSVCSGSFVVGDFPESHDTWQGELGGLAIYQHGIAAGQVKLDYRSWRASGRPAEASSGTPAALYLFDEKDGSLIRDHGAAKVDLVIPRRYVVVRPTLLQTPWRWPDTPWGAIQDIFVNICGFIPFGFTLIAFLSSRRNSVKLGAITVLIGFLLSLTIEVLQAHLPTRDSDLRDVLTNTLGTLLGVMLYRKCLVWGILAAGSQRTRE